MLPEIGDLVKIKETDGWGRSWTETPGIVTNIVDNDAFPGSRDRKNTSYIINLCTGPKVSLNKPEASEMIEILAKGKAQ